MKKPITCMAKDSQKIIFGLLKKQFPLTNIFCLTLNTGE
jgi:hypothetical protein